MQTVTVKLLTARVGMDFSHPAGSEIDVPADEAARLVTSEQARYVSSPPSAEPVPEPVAPREMTDVSDEATADEPPPFEPDPPAVIPEPVAEPQKVEQQPAWKSPVPRPKFG